MTVREILRILSKDGWFIVRQSGSHRQLNHASKPGTVTVAGKPSRTLHPKILASILRQAGLENEA
jgi:predicted RNA binding protein YcfA (HicA-like mRNA interferase family)